MRPAITVARPSLAGPAPVEADRPRLDRPDDEVRPAPGIARERRPDCVLGFGLDRMDDALLVAERPAQDEEACLDEAVHERGVRVPARLLFQRASTVILGTGPEDDDVEYRHVGRCISLYAPHGRRASRAYATIGGVLVARAARWVTDVIGPGSRIVSARRLRLGGWHVNHALDVVDGQDRTRRLVLRRWARPGWEDDDPDYTVERETRALGLLRPTQVPVPEIVAADPIGVACDVPAILLTRLTGHPPQRADTDTADFGRQLAETLARIHDVNGAAAGQLAPYRLYYDRAHAVPARWMAPTAAWKQATAAVREPPPPTTMTMIHRDYHPENTLWSRGRLTGVVDWTQASWGPPALDLGHMRWNLVADHGQHVADQFLACYRAIIGSVPDDQPYWDLVALLDLLLDGDDPGDIEPADLRRFEDYAATALSRLNRASS